jgi:hypothetical protein
MYFYLFLLIYLAIEAFQCVINARYDNEKNELKFLKENFQCMYGEKKMEYFPSEISEFIYEINNKKLTLNFQENNGEIKQEVLKVGLKHHTYKGK